jgi:hypothetical protein
MRDLEPFEQNCSRFFGAAEVDLSRCQLGTSVLICPGAGNGPDPPLALPNQRPPLFLKCSRRAEKTGAEGITQGKRGRNRGGFSNAPGLVFIGGSESVS